MMPGLKIAELVKDAIAVTGAKLVEDLEPGTPVLWRVPGRNGSWQTHDLIGAAIQTLGKAAWE
jgi:hypothetical protein